MANTRHFIAELQRSDSETIRIAYIDQPPTTTTSSDPDKIILLIHGFPQTSHQFRHVLPIFAAAGYRCIVPDYRGAGASSRPASSDFRKSTMARDLIALLDHLSVTSAVHIVGHDIGGMVAWSLATRYPQRARSVCWGECPLPGTELYRQSRTDNVVSFFHFIFHSVADLPEALVAGRERVYVHHFFSKLAYTANAFSEADIDYYAAAYAKPGALRCGFGVYRAFEADAEENVQWIKQHGKCKVPTMVLSGGQSLLKNGAEAMMAEVTEDANAEIGLVTNSGHWLAEEQPENFAATVLDFVSRH